jgi:hypothetical protein
MRVAVGVIALLAALPAHAGPFWERPRRTGYSLGLSLVANLGPLTDRWRP